MVPLLPTSACTRNAELGHSPTRRSSDLALENEGHPWRRIGLAHGRSLATGKRHKQRLAGESGLALRPLQGLATRGIARSEEHTSELQSRGHLVCRLLLEKKNTSE